MFKIIKKSIIALGLLSVPFLTGCTFDQPIEYNNNLVGFVNEAVDTYSKYTKSFEDKKVTIEELKTKNEEIIKKVEESLKKIEEKGGYNGDDVLLNASKEYVQEIINVLKNEEKEILDLDNSEESKSKSEKLFENIDSKLDKSYKNFEEAQAQFGKDHGFQVEEKKGTDYEK